MKKITVTPKHVQAALKVLGYTSAAGVAITVLPVPPLILAAAAAAFLGHEIFSGYKTASWNAKSQQERDHIALLSTIKSSLRKRGMSNSEENIKAMAATLKIAWGESDHPNKEQICAIYDGIIQKPR